MRSAALATRRSIVPSFRVRDQSVFLSFQTFSEGPRGSEGLIPSVGPVKLHDTAGDALGAVSGAQEGEAGRASYCLALWGTSRPVSKVTWKQAEGPMKGTRIKSWKCWILSLKKVKKNKNTLSSGNLVAINTIMLMLLSDDWGNVQRILLGIQWCPGGGGDSRRFKAVTALKMLFQGCYSLHQDSLTLLKKVVNCYS